MKINVGAIRGGAPIGETEDSPRNGLDQGLVVANKMQEEKWVNKKKKACREGNKKEGKTDLRRAI